jgi:hypothetical protein
MSKIYCPHCGEEIDPAALLGAIRSEAKAEASRRNGILSGGAPKRDFTHKPGIEITLDDGTALDFYYQRGRYLYWLTPKKKGETQYRIKTDRDGVILERWKFSGRMRK